MARKEIITERIGKLVSGFDRYVQVHEQRVPFTGEQLTAHRQTIVLRRQAASVEAAVGDPAYVASLRRTLLAWGIGRRASRLVPEEDFALALQAALPVLGEFASVTIDAIEDGEAVADQLWRAISTLGVVTNQAKLVAGTKTLHHLLPELVVPMDRAWTGTFFRLHLPEWQDPASQRRIFRMAYGHLARVARQVQPQRLVTGDGWCTSRTKVLDNALIGFCKAELGTVPLPADDAPNQVTFDVPGYPPAKNEALSMLGAGHSHAPRVRLLLEAAARARDEQGFRPIDNGQIAMEVVVSAPAPGAPSDATNYLGGIADVLEDKAARGNLSHIGDLAGIWLYRNDRQIKDIAYREVQSDQAEYSVTIRALK